MRRLAIASGDVRFRALLTGLHVPANVSCRKEQIKNNKQATAATKWENPLSGMFFAAPARGICDVHPSPESASPGRTNRGNRITNIPTASGSTPFVAANRVCPPNVALHGRASPAQTPALLFDIVKIGPDRAPLSTTRGRRRFTTEAVRHRDSKPLPGTAHRTRRASLRANARRKISDASRAVRDARGVSVPHCLCGSIFFFCAATPHGK